MSYTIEWDSLSREEWINAARAFSDHNIYQTWDFGEVHSASQGRSVRRLLVKRGKRPVAMVQCRVKRLPLRIGGVADVKGGPLWRSGSEDEPTALSVALEAMRQELVFAEHLDLRVRCRGERDGENALIEKALTSTGYRRGTERPYHTFVVDLEQPLDELRTNLRQNWRNHLKRAEKHGLEVVFGSDGEAFEHFAQIYAPMWRRKRFDSGKRMGLLEQMHRRLPDGERLCVGLAYSDGTPLAAHVTSTLGDTCLSYLSATSSEGRKANAAYLLRWALFERLKQQHVRWYDAGGHNRVTQTGVSDFKEGMSGREVVFPGCFEVDARKLANHLYYWAENTFRSARRLVRRVKR